MKKLLIIFCVLLVTVEVAQAQSFFNDRHNRRFIASVGSGITSYYGDLNNPKDLIDGKFNMSFGLKFMVTPQIGIRGELQYYRIAGSDAVSNFPGTVNRNLSFVANNSEINITGSYDILPAGGRYYQRPPINPYVFGGIGVTFYKPKAEYNGKTYALRRLETEGVKYGPVAIVLPFGVGARIKAGPYFNAVVEAGYRKTFTDYLDDVSTEYVDNSSFTDPIAAALADRGPEVGASLREAGKQRGNPSKKDSYFIVSAKLEFYIPSNIINLEALKRRQGYKPPRQRGFRLFGR